MACTFCLRVVARRSNLLLLLLGGLTCLLICPLAYIVLLSCDCRRIMYA